MQSDVEKEGFLWKKSPTGLKGFRQWQKRWFVLTKRALSYYKEKEDKKSAGFIPLAQIIDSVYLPQKRVGCRLDIRVKNHLRVYSLNAPSIDEAKLWVSVINKAVQRSRTDDKAEPQRQPAAPRHADLTKLQLLFAMAKFGKGIKEKLSPKEEKNVQVAMHKDFPTESHVLRWLLDNVLNPAAKIFYWDYRTDLEIDEKEKKDKEKEKDKDSKEVVKEEIKCPVAKCKLPLICGWGQCQVHMNHRVPTKQPDGTVVERDRLLDLVKSPEFLRYTLKVFETPSEAHGLAIRVIWILMHGREGRKEAGDQFCSYITIHCSNQNFNQETNKALAYILLNDKIYTYEELTITFFLPTQHWTCWKTYFGCLVGSSVTIRESALEDITTVLHENLGNCESLQRGTNWQEWIYQLFVDIPKELEGPIKTVHGYCVNVITLVLFQFCMRHTSFSSLFLSSLQSLHQFGGSTMEGHQLASVFFCALLSKLTSDKILFHFNDLKAVEWQNLRELCRVAQKFIFKTAFWNTRVSEEEEGEGEGVEGAPDGSPPSPTISVVSTPSTPPHFSLQQVPRDSSHDLFSSTAVSVSSYSDYKESISEVSLSRPSAAPYKKIIKPSQFVLQKVRHASKDQKSFFDEETQLRDFGFHWTEDGACGDILICDRILTLFRALSLDVYNPDLRLMTKEDKECLQIFAKDYEFWEDAKKFCTLVNRNDIEEKKILTYRKLSWMVENFLKAGHNKSDRKSVLKELTKIQSKYLLKSDELSMSKSSRLEGMPHTPVSKYSELRSSEASKEGIKDGSRGGLETPRKQTEKPPPKPQTKLDSLPEASGEPREGVHSD